MAPRLIRILVPGVLIAAGLACSKSDADRLEGTWLLVEGETKGGPISKERLEKSQFRLRFAGGVCTETEGTGKPREEDFVLRPYKSPREIDLTPRTGADKGQVLAGIYEFDGDRLRMCLNTDPGPRPAEFKPGGEGDAQVLVFEREE